MELVHLIKAFVLGIVEGLTEFLPVSSTGHLILAGDWLNFYSGSGKVFEVVIQLGAILAVCWLYREKILTLVRGVLARDPAALRFAGVVLVAFLPSVVFGILFIKTIKAVLFNPTVVSISLVVGGLIILWVERRERPIASRTMEEIGWFQAFGIGLAQVVSMIPGVSRSGATIVGGMVFGASRTAATEFSFFLAMPTMLGATVLDLAKNGASLSFGDFVTIVVGFVTAFVSAIVVVKFLIRYVAHHTLSVFAWYRIALGVVLLAWTWLATA
ncbi:undecaprenyl-diphosphate phosphatase [Pinisolibacter sp.]|uniref:undecaprenyl-diphosphate phosphatase n=1 Tax=Pinisolibacter sp. TaxID=2172024 RepID=UPI002FDDA10A